MYKSATGVCLATSDELAREKFLELDDKWFKQCISRPTALSDPQCKKLAEERDRAAQPDLATMAREGGNPCDHFPAPGDSDLCYKCAPTTRAQAMTCVQDYRAAEKEDVDASANQLRVCDGLPTDDSQCAAATERMIRADFMDSCIRTGVGKTHCDARWAANPRAAEAEVRAQMQTAAEAAEQPPAESSDQAQQIHEQAQQIEEQRSELEQQQRQFELKREELEDERDIMIGAYLFGP